MTSKNMPRSSVFKLDQDTPRIHPWYKFGPSEINICLSFHVEIDSNNLMSRSSIFELNQDTPEIHPWYKPRLNEFGPDTTNSC